MSELLDEFVSFARCVGTFRKMESSRIGQKYLVFVQRERNELYKLYTIQNGMLLFWSYQPNVLVKNATASEKKCPLKAILRIVKLAL